MSRDQEIADYYGPRGYEGEPVQRWRLRNMAARLRRRAEEMPSSPPGCRTYRPEDDVYDLSDPRLPDSPLCTDHHHEESETP